MKWSRLRIIHADNVWFFSSNFWQQIFTEGLCFEYYLLGIYKIWSKLGLFHAWNFQTKIMFEFFVHGIKFHLWSLLRILLASIVPEMLISNTSPWLYRHDSNLEYSMHGIFRENLCLDFSMHGIKFSLINYALNIPHMNFLVMIQV